MYKYIINDITYDILTCYITYDMFYIHCHILYILFNDMKYIIYMKYVIFYSIDNI